MKNKGTGFWVLQAPGWLLLVYLVYAQVIAAFDYELGIAMGTQESAQQITEVGVAFWYGFAFGDMAIYVPLLFLGLVGHASNRAWGQITLSAALGITIYWPVVCLAAIVAAHDAPGWNLAYESELWVVLPPITLWGIWGLWFVTHAARR